MKKSNKILLIIMAVLLLMQLIRPSYNVSDVQTNHVSTKYAMSSEVKDIMAAACDDCHSNKTRYPWYAKVQPMAWWLGHHVEEGKEHFNVSEFTTLPIAVQNHKFEETIEMVKEGEMPLHSYTWLGLHAEAKLSDAQREVIIKWAQVNMDSLKAQYPADSLVLKRRKKS